MKILFTAFEPFGGETVNPAQEAVKLLPNEIGGCTVVKLTLPVVFSLAGDMAVKTIRAEKPDAVICVGQAGGRNGMTVERVAINAQDARMPDNAGNCPADATICPDGPAAYFSTLPFRKMVNEMQKAGLTASVSNTAGTYVCNDLFYHVMRETCGTSVRAGFIHVPYIPEQTQNKPNTPSMPLEDIVRALTVCAESLQMQ